MGRRENNTKRYFDVLLTMHLSTFISVINKLDAQNCCFTISLFHASTCFVHMCSSSGGQKLQYTASGIITLKQVSGLYNSIKMYFSNFRPLTCFSVMIPEAAYCNFWPPDDEHMCSKHVEAWNKFIVKQKFCASSWLISEINYKVCYKQKCEYEDRETQLNIRYIRGLMWTRHWTFEHHLNDKHVLKWVLLHAAF